jgi:hypothetical protein
MKSRALVHTGLDSVQKVRIEQPVCTIASFVKPVRALANIGGACSKRSQGHVVAGALATRGGQPVFGGSRRRRGGRGTCRGCGRGPGCANEQTPGEAFDQHQTFTAQVQVSFGIHRDWHKVQEHHRVLTALVLILIQVGHA